MLGRQLVLDAGSLDGLVADRKADRSRAAPCWNRRWARPECGRSDARHQAVVGRFKANSTTSDMNTSPSELTASEISPEENSPADPHSGQARSESPVALSCFSSEKDFGLRCWLRELIAEAKSEEAYEFLASQRGVAVSIPSDDGAEAPRHEAGSDAAVGRSVLGTRIVGGKNNGLPNCSTPNSPMIC